MKDDWTPILGYEKFYEVTSDGRVRSLPNCRRKTILVLRLHSTGPRDYLQAVLQHGHKRKYFQVHRLVATAFIPNPENKPQVNHKNGIRDDNRVENLEWVTARENCIHSIRTGLSTIVRGMAHGMRKLDEEKVHQIRTLNESGLSRLKLAKQFGVSLGCIRKVVLRIDWSHI